MLDALSPFARATLRVLLRTSRLKQAQLDLAQQNDRGLRGAEDELVNAGLVRKSSSSGIRGGQCFELVLSQEAVRIALAMASTAQTVESRDVELKAFHSLNSAIDAG